MTDQITTEAGDTSYAVVAPYDPTFVAGAKRLHGKWDAARKAWSFDLRDREAVNAILADIYGWSPEATCETVTVRISLGALCGSREAPELRIAGRRVAWRPGRDEPVRTAENVRIVSGEFPRSGGSMRFPTLNPVSGTILEIRDLPASAVPLIDKSFEPEIVDEGGAARSALEAELAAARARVAELEALLSDHQ
jgi:hypothetical protein